MKPRQIVILQDRLRPGGTERQSIWLTQNLSTDSLATSLLLFQPPDSAFPPPAGLPVRALQTRRTPFPWFAPGLIRTLRALETDLVICMGRNANAYGHWIRRRLPRIRLITTCRTNQSLPLLYRRSIRASHHCIANSQWAADRLVQTGLKSASEIAVIPNALLRPSLFQLDRSPATMAAARTALRLPPDSPVLCNIASFVPGKNKQSLLRAFAQTKTRDTILLLVGTGPELAACRKLAAKLKLENRVRFLGHTESIEPILQSSDLFVSTALRDALPNALVEAQAVGLPVIAYNTAGTSETFIHGNTGQSIPPGDETGFARAIDDLLASPEKRKTFATAARFHAREHFFPETIAARYRKLLAEILAQ